MLIPHMKSPLLTATDPGGLGWVYEVVGQEWAFMGLRTLGKMQEAPAGLEKRGQGAVSQE